MAGCAACCLLLFFGIGEACSPEVYWFLCPSMGDYRMEVRPMCTVVDRVVVDASASDFAFQAGRLLELLALEDGINAAQEVGVLTVTAAQIQSCLTPALFDRLVARMKEDCAGGTPGSRAVAGGDKEAA